MCVCVFVSVCIWMDRIRLCGKIKRVLRLPSVCFCRSSSSSSFRTAELAKLAGFALSSHSTLLHFQHGQGKKEREKKGNNTLVLCCVYVWVFMCNCLRMFCMTGLCVGERWNAQLMVRLVDFMVVQYKIWVKCHVFDRIQDQFNRWLIVWSRCCLNIRIAFGNKVN